MVRVEPGVKEERGGEVPDDGEVVVGRGLVVDGLLAEAGEVVTD